MKLFAILMVAGGVWYWWNHQYQSTLQDDASTMNAADFKAKYGKWPWQMGYPIQVRVPEIGNRKWWTPRIS